MAKESTKITSPKIYKKETDIPRGTKKCDTAESATGELFFIENPHVRKSTPEANEQLREYACTSVHTYVWAYYPWRKLAVRIPEERVYYRLRTARNKHLITEKEQRRFRDASIGITGLSVGSAVAAALVSTGGPKHMRLADPDILEITNLNRISAKLPDIGENKTTIAARSAWELDPFLELDLWPDGVSRKSLKKFLTGKKKLDVFVDEMDNVELKILSRALCRELHIPVVMATDNGDSIIVDVERFDTEPGRPVFHGRIEFSNDEIANLDRDQFIKLASKIIDPTYFTQRQQQSLMDIGKSLSGIAQLGTAATIAGAAVAYVSRRIITGVDMPSGRYVMGCEPTFIPGYNSAAEKKKRAAHTKKFINSFK